MQVTFSKVDGRRYRVAIQRDHGPALVPRFGPGYDDLMPHDLAHYLVEEHFGIELGVWGQLAAGGAGVVTPASEDNTLRHRRRVQRIGAIGRADMVRSEQLAWVTVAAWERSIGRVRRQPEPIEVAVDPDELSGAVRRMAGVAERWRRLPPDGSLTFTWPRHLTFDAAGSHRGRRAARQREARSSPRRAWAPSIGRVRHQTASRTG